MAISSTITYTVGSWLGKETAGRRRSAGAAAAALAGFGLAAASAAEPRACGLKAEAARQATQPDPAAGGTEEAQPAPDAPGIAFWPPAPLTEPLVTDRPDFTESTTAVPRGHFQLEGGYTFTYDREGRQRSMNHTAPELLLRTGLAPGFELRLGWEGYSWVEEQSEGQSRAGRTVTFEDWSAGASDLSVGFKYIFCEQEGLRPHFGVIGAVTLPTGSAGFSSGDVDPEVKLLWAYDLSEDVGLAGNLNFAAPTDESDRFFQTAASISLSHALSEQVGAYFEYFGFYPNRPGSDCAHSLNGGLTWQITDNLQLDWRAGFGLNEEADDFFTGAGFAIRL